jgi:hypothetical protein
LDSLLEDIHGLLADSVLDSLLYVYGLETEVERVSDSVHVVLLDQVLELAG